MTVNTDTPAADDDRLEPEQRRWLILNGYESLEEWARDSDYYRNDACEDGIWIDDQGNEQEIVGALTGAIEAQSCEYEVRIANVFHATDQADAVEQMIEWLTAHGGAARGSYRWERLVTLTHAGQELPHETGVLDADDLPDKVQPQPPVHATTLLAAASTVTVAELATLMDEHSDDGQWKGADICDALAGLIRRHGGWKSCVDHGCYAATNPTCPFDHY